MSDFSLMSACLLKMFMSAKPAVAMSALLRPVRSKEISVTVAVATPNTAVTHSRLEIKKIKTGGPFGGQDTLEDTL